MLARVRSTGCFFEARSKNAIPLGKTSFVFLCEPDVLLCKPLCERLHGMMKSHHILLLPCCGTTSCCQIQQTAITCKRNADGGTGRQGGKVGQIQKLQWHNSMTVCLDFVERYENRTKLRTRRHFSHELKEHFPKKLPRPRHVPDTTPQHAMTPKPTPHGASPKRHRAIHHRGVTLACHASCSCLYFCFRGAA